MEKADRAGRWSRPSAGALGGGGGEKFRLLLHATQPAPQTRHVSIRIRIRHMGRPVMPRSFQAVEMIDQFGPFRGQHALFLPGALQQQFFHLGDRQLRRGVGDQRRQFSLHPALEILVADHPPICRLADIAEPGQAVEKQAQTGGSNITQRPEQRALVGRPQFSHSHHDVLLQWRQKLKIDLEEACQQLVGGQIGVLKWTQTTACAGGDEETAAEKLDQVGMAVGGPDDLLDQRRICVYALFRLPLYNQRGAVVCIELSEIEHAEAAEERVDGRPRR